MHKLIEASVFAAIGVLVFASLLIPVVDDATATTDTFKNDGYFNMTELTETDNYKLDWLASDPYTVTINDTDTVSLANLPFNAAFTLLGSNEFCVRFMNTPDNPRIQVYGGVGWGYGGSAGTDFNITLEEGVLSMSNTADTPFTASGAAPSKLYGIDKGGEYVLKKIDSPAYMLGDSSLIVLCGVTDSAYGSPAIYAEGTIDDGLDYTLFRPSAQSETAVFSNESITASDVAGYIGLKSLDRIEFDITLNEGTVEPTYRYFVVPAKVTAERAIYADEPTREVLEIMPLILIAGLIIGVLGYAVYSRIE